MSSAGGQELDLRVDGATERQTLGTCLPRWLDISAGTVRPRTLERYRQIVRVHLLPALGDQPPASLRPAAGDRLAPLWALAIHTGCRQGELLCLSWADVDLDGGTLTVRRTLTRAGACVPQFGDPKSATSRRTLSLPEEAIAALRAHRARQNQERLAAGANWADYGLVFATQPGTLLLQRNVIRDFKAALARAGLPQTIRFDDLRHAHATLILRAGVPLKVASGRLRHSSIGVTAGLYQHLAQDLDADAAARAQQAVRGRGRERAGARAHGPASALSHDCPTDGPGDQKTRPQGGF